MRWTLVAAVIAGACGAPTPQGPPPEYPGTLIGPEALRSPAALGDAFALEQRVRSIYPEGEQSFRAVLQRRAGRLVLVGFGPHGGRGFVLTHTGTTVDFENHLPRDLPFPPEFMLHDVQRVWFRGLSGPLPDGEHQAELDGERVVERWEGGRLRERRFSRPERRGAITVSYGDGLGEDGPPPEVTLDNGWFGYRLVLTTLSHHRLDEPEPALEPTAGGESEDPPVPGPTDGARGEAEN